MRDSIGGYLARERQLRGISLDELAETTRIPRRSLERLESGAFDKDPDGFVRGFVRTVAGALGLEPDQTVIRMLPEPGAASVRTGVPVPAALVLALLVVVLGVGLPWAVLHLLSGPSRAEVVAASAPPEQTVRRDRVRQLAESVGALDAAEPEPLLPDAP